MSMESLEGEIWENIKKFGGRYQISNLGRIRVMFLQNKIPVTKELILKYNYVKNTAIVQLTNGIKRRSYNVKNLIVEHFLINRILTDDEKNRICYKDNNARNVCASNLCIKSKEKFVEEKWNELYILLKPIYDKKKRMPNNNEIKQYKNGNTILNIIYRVLNSDIIKVAKKFNFDFEKYVKPTIYKPLTDLIKHINDNYNGVVPTLEEAYKEKNDERSLVEWIRYHGGLTVLHKHMNQPIKHTYTALDQINYYGSTYEAIFANYLHINKIKFEYNKEIVAGHSPAYRYDFRIKNKNNEFIYFEIWGLKHEKYLAKQELKIQVYKKMNFKLESIDGKLFDKNSNDIYLAFNDLMSNNNIKKIKFSKNVKKLYEYKHYNHNIIFNEMKIFAEVFGLIIMPSTKTWINNGFTRHINYFLNRKMPINEVADALNLTVIKHSAGYWKEFSNLKKELLPIIKNNNNNWISQDYLERIEKYDVTVAIYMFWGGFPKCAKLFGFERYKDGGVKYRKIPNWTPPE